ncbi:DUF1876 domain-containing protein [Actinoallomurus iriomotensis]|uniref:DUF1876 domain-containing protein n=1 Tax=Actinoallomurus iriomotensis TaxID=478107 RepID=A0A9W6VZ62_9ACTN|nr:DUF1876 domain-containing protein [Actinoallomurus iriomotensis]GLY85014.1 hypothetical protein Airi02_029430 [Actinoallomurus iriomotensis]
MNTIDRWSVDIYLDETDGETHAEARLATRETDGMRGRGKARCNPADWDVPEIGAELAAARALSDLAHRLLDAAAADIEAVTHEHVNLADR